MAVTAPRGIECQGGIAALPDPILKSIGIGTVYPGTLVMSAAAGYLLNGADTASCKCEGIAKGGGTATANGAFNVPVYPRGVFKFKNSVANPVTQAHVGDHAYVEDNETVASTTTNFVRAGIVEGIASDGVWINIRKEVLKESPELENGGEDEMDMTGMDADAMAITVTGVVDVVWADAVPTTVLSCVDRLARETAYLPGGPVPRTDRRTAIYVDAGAGLDAQSGGATDPVLTMDRAAEIVPPFGNCTIYVSGDPGWTGGGQYPYAGYKGHLTVIAVDALTVVGAADTIAAYGAGTGGFGQDSVTPNVIVPNDATDRSRFLLLEDDAADVHIVKILEVAGGAWLTEPAALTITGANDVTLIDLTQTLAPTNYVTASPLHHEGDVKFVGFNITSPGADGLTGFGFAACVIDGTGDVHALNMGYNAMLGGLTIDAAMGVVAPAIHVPAAALVGSVFETIQHNNGLPGNHFTGAGGASMIRLISASSPGCGRVIGTVWEAADFYLGNPEAEMLMDLSRGVLAASGIQVMDGAHLRVGNSQMGDLITGADTEVILTNDIGVTIAEIDGVLKAAGVGGNESVIVNDAAKAGGSDTYGFVTGHHAELQGITVSGNMWPAATALPAVIIRGWSQDLRLTLNLTLDRGAGDYVQIDGGYHYLGPCTGDNSNVGGTGMSLIGLGTRVSVQNGFAITGNGGGTTTVGIGAKGHVALPGAGTLENDFAAAGALTATEQLCIFEHRA